MDAAGFGKAVLFGIIDGRPAAMVFAATQPERTRTLILTGTFAHFHLRRVQQHRPRRGRLAGAHFFPGLGGAHAPSTEQIARLQEFGRAIRSASGQRCCGAEGSAAVGAVAAPARDVGAHEHEPGDGLGAFELGDCSGSTSGRSCPTISVPNSSHPCPRGPRSGAGRPVPGRPRPWGAVASRSTARTTRPGSPIPTRIMTGIEVFLTGGHTERIAVASRPAHGVVHRYRRPRRNTPRRPAKNDERQCSPALVSHRRPAATLRRRGVEEHRRTGRLVTFDGPTQADPLRRRLARSAPRHWASGSAPASPHSECELLGTKTSGDRRTYRGADSRSGRGGPKSSSTEQFRTWSSARAPASRIAAASSCVAYPACGGHWRWIRDGARGGVGRGGTQRQRPPTALAPRCAGQIAPWR